LAEGEIHFRGGFLDVSHEARRRHAGISAELVHLVRSGLDQHGRAVGPSLQHGRFQHKMMS